MALTILQEPLTYTSGFDPQIFIASASNSYLAPFRYKVELQIAASTVATFYLVKRPNGNCLFDAQRTIENYLSYNFDSIKSLTYGWVNGASNIFKKYNLKITSQYYISPLWSDMDTVTTNDYYAINSALDYITWQDNNNNDYLIGATGTKKFLTNTPTIPIRENESFELAVMTNTNDAVKRLVIDTFDSSGTLIATGTINNATTTISGDNGRFLSILCGTSDINNSTLSSGSNPLITDSVSYYEVYVQNTSNTRRTEKKRFVIDRTCTRETSFRLAWLNPLGRFDMLTFTGVKDDSISVEKSNYNKTLGLEGTTSLTYDTTDRQTTPFFTEVSQKYKLRSGFLSTEQSEWLKELFASPVVFCLINGSWYAINVTQTTYQVKKTIQEKLFIIELDMELANKTQRQRL